MTQEARLKSETTCLQMERQNIQIETDLAHARIEAERQKATAETLHIIREDAEAQLVTGSPFYTSNYNCIRLLISAHEALVDAKASKAALEEVERKYSELSSRTKKVQEAWNNLDVT